MRPIRRILVPVRDFSAASLPAISKAAQLAAALGAKLELFHDLADPIAVDGTWRRPRQTLARLKVDLRQPAIDGLERLAVPLRARGLAVSISAVWDFPPYEAILRRAAAIGADLIVATCRNRHRMPGLLGYTDWELLRLSPIPVLLVKNSTPYRRPKVLAAVDPTHAHSKPSALDRRILYYGAQLGGALRGALHAVHAYTPRPLPPTVTFDIKRRKQLLAEDEHQARETFDALVEKTIPAVRRHLVPGAPAAAIPATARKTGSAIVVIGAVSRSALKRLFIGNTAESVMDQLRCDLLVVKPAKFALKAPRARRGLQFLSIAPAPI
jgi:universal stress protein E